MDQIVALVGNVDEGKSTLTNALVGSGIVAPYSPLKLTSALSEIRLCKDKTGRYFGVKFADGEEKDVDIQDLWNTMSEGQKDKDIERLILYAESSVLLEHLRLIDLPGLKMDHDPKVLEFLHTETPDVLVYVTSDSDSVRLFEVSDTTQTLPSEKVIVVTKLDKGIDWEAAPCLERMAIETENRVREGLTDGNAEVVAVSALVALASQMWTDEILEGVLRLAADGGFDLLSKTTYFGESRAGIASIQDRRAILDAANACFQGPWISPDYCKPAWPALMCAMGLAIHQEGETSPDALRQSMWKFSGMARLRSVLLAISQSDRITARYDALAAVGEVETERFRLRRSIGHVRSLLETTDRIATTVEGIGHTEEHRYFTELKAFLESREVELSVCLREKQQWLSKMRQAYQETTASDE